jgi:hypothetical protein
MTEAYDTIKLKSEAQKVLYKTLAKYKLPKDYFSVEILPHESTGVKGDVKVRGLAALISGPKVDLDGDLVSEISSNLVSLEGICRVLVEIRKTK